MKGVNWGSISHKGAFDWPEQSFEKVIFSSQLNERILMRLSSTVGLEVKQSHMEGRHRQWPLTPTIIITELACCACVSDIIHHGVSLWLVVCLTKKETNVNWNCWIIIKSCHYLRGQKSKINMWRSRWDLTCLWSIWGVTSDKGDQCLRFETKCNYKTWHHQRMSHFVYLETKIWFTVELVWIFWIVENNF